MGLLGGGGGVQEWVGRRDFLQEAPGVAPIPHFTAWAHLHSAVVEMVAVLLRATLHLQGQHPGWPADIGLPGIVLGMVEVIVVLLRSCLGFKGAPWSPGTAGEDLYTWFHLFGDLILLQRLHSSYAQDAGRGEQKSQGCSISSCPRGGSPSGRRNPGGTHTHAPTHTQPAPEVAISISGSKQANLATYPASGLDGSGTWGL